MTLHCEVESRPEGLAEAIVATVTALTGLRGTIALVAPGALANDGKVIDDRRPHD
jgi:phenylacetate-CoA ligase